MKKNEILAITFLVSLCSMCYELIMADTLAIMTGKHIFWQAITIAIFIASMGVGTNRTTKIENEDYEKQLIKVEFLLSLFGSLTVLSLFIFRTVYIFFDNNSYISVLNDAQYQSEAIFIKGGFILLSQGVTFILGYLTGQEIPLLIQYGQKEDHHWTNYILGVNYIGTLFGSVILVMFLIPKLDIINTSILISFFNFLIFLFIRYKTKTKLNIIPRVSLFIAVLLFINVSKHNVLQAYLKMKYYHFDSASISTKLSHFFKFVGEMIDTPPVKRKKSLYQYIDSYEAHDYSNGTTGIQLSLDEEFQFSYITEKHYHESMAHIPIMAKQEAPKEVLILGGGDGLLVRELLMYPELNITQIELDEEMVKTCLTDPRITALNEKSMADPRVDLKFMDGFWYLRNTKKKFDAIWIDFPYPKNFNVIKLYSKEFYTFAKRALNPGGYLLIGLPIEAKNSGFEFSKTDQIRNDIYFSTLFYSGFKHFVPFYVGVHSFLMAAPESFPQKPLKSLLDVEYQELSEEDLDVYSLDFPRNINKELINSIFKPILVKYISD